MALQFYIGRSGFGKSYRLANTIIKESMDHPENNYIVLVPEQATMQTKRRYIGLHPNKTLLNIDVLNFPRLAFRVLDEIGAGKLPVLDDIGKSLILRKLAIDNEKYLKVLGKNIQKIGYIQEIKSVISEMEQYRISQKILAKNAAGMNSKPLLQYKLEDLSVLYKAYQEFLSGKYIVSEELLEVTASHLDKSDIVRNTIFVLDGFTGFTPVQYGLLEGLLKCAKNVILTVTMDERAYPVMGIKEQELFALSKKTVKHMTELAKETGCSILEPVVCSDRVPMRYKNEQNGSVSENEELTFLEKHIFRYGTDTFDKEVESISVHELLTPYSEVEFVSRKMKEIVRNSDYHYRDFAIVCGDLEEYAPYLEQVFDAERIPYYKDNKRCILENPMLECIVSAIEMLIKDFSYESVFRYLKSGLSDLTKEEVDCLENYVLACGIRGSKKWQKEFVRKLRGMSDQELLLLNESREKLLQEVSGLFDGMKGNATVKEKTKQLYLFLEERGIQRKLESFEESFKEKNELVLAREYGQIYKLLMDLLDIYVNLLGEEKVALKEYWDILRAGFEQTMVGSIPSGSDQVMVGDIERSRLDEVKVVFFVGCNDGKIPKSDGKKSLLSELEREVLREHDMELAPGPREKYYTQKYYLYLNLTKPKERLFLTYAKTDREGGSLRPSYIIGSLQKLFPKLLVRSEDLSSKEYFQSERHVRDYLLKGLEKDDPDKEWKELFSWYLSREENSEKKKGFSFVELLDIHFTRNTEDAISEAVAKTLYGTTLEGSVTRLERYASCAYAHFLSYGLRLREREEFELAPTDMGTIFHKTLDLYARCLKREKLSWIEITEEKSNEILEECLQKALEDYTNSNLYETARNRYMEDRIRRILRRTLWSIKKQLEKGKFTPERFEVAFERNKPLTENRNLILRGRIDRMDSYEEDGKLYLKIIDYKSGSVKFDITAVYMGLQLQLPFYLIEAMRYMKEKHPDREIIPAGIVYASIDDPVVDHNNQSEEEIERALFKEYKLSGMVREEREILDLFDDTAGASDIIPVKYNKDGSLSKSSSVYGEDDFETVEAYVGFKTKQFGEEIVAGNIKMNPVDYGAHKSCQYCEFRKICPFDGSRDSCRRGVDGGKEEILQRMKRDMHGDKVDE